MSAGTKIEWTDRTWNVVSGCTRVSLACDHCYIERTPPFRMAHRKFDKPGVGGTTGVTLHPERVDQPLRWRNPSKVFVCSLADLFHEEVPDLYLERVFDVMEYARAHTFQVLTKRPARMRAFIRRREARRAEYAAKFDHCPTEAMRNSPAAAHARVRAATPPRNIWLGVTVENQQWADTRVPILIDTPAAVRFISAEPLLGPLEIGEFAHGIDWVITGGETGPGARPTDPAWFRGLRDQCTNAGAAFHFKQWGDWAPTGAGVAHVPGRRPDPKTRPQKACFCGPDPTDFHVEMARVGKKLAGRKIDGRTWDEFPVVAP